MKRRAGCPVASCFAFPSFPFSSHHFLSSPLFPCISLHFASAPFNSLDFTSLPSEVSRQTDDDDDDDHHDVDHDNDGDGCLRHACTPKTQYVKGFIYIALRDSQPRQPHHLVGEMAE